METTLTNDFMAGIILLVAFAGFICYFALKRDDDPHPAESIVKPEVKKSAVNTKKWEGSRSDLQKMTKKQIDELAADVLDLKLDRRQVKQKLVDQVWTEINK